MRIAAGQLVQVAIFPPRYTVGEQNPQMIADDFVRHWVVVVSEVRLTFDGFHPDDIFLPASLFRRHCEPDPAIAASAGECDRLAIDFAAFVPEYHLRRLTFTVLTRNDDVDHRRILFSDCGRGFDAQ